jgi:deazaflavin-dependent oxidoreductase (nitroreductase family)
VIPRFAPDAPKPFHYRLLVTIGRSRPGRWFGIHVASRIDPWLVRKTKGRFTSFPGARMLLLTVPGRKSGAVRTNALLYFTQNDDVILIASSFGRDKHPAWYRNVKAHPEVTLTSRGKTGRYVAEEVADADERRRLLDLSRLIYAGYEDYEARTAASGRVIPVLRLRPVEV